MNNLLEEETKRDKLYFLEPTYKVETSTISTLYKCQTTDSKRLHIPDIYNKLTNNQQYDIGGTFSGSLPEFWFFCTTHLCLDPTLCLLSIFVCHRHIGNFSIGVSKDNTWSSEKLDVMICTLSNNLDWFTFESSIPNEKFHIKTFCLPIEDIKKAASEFSGMVYIPLMIKTNISKNVSQDLINKVKMDHYKALQLRTTTPDCVILSSSGRKFPSHKLILSIHSEVLAEMLKTNSQLFLDISDEDIEYLLNFVYDGTIEETFNENLSKLLEMGKKFKLFYLIKLIEPMIIKIVNLDNVFEMMALSKKYELFTLKEHLFKFIKENPKVFLTSGWEQFEDLSLVKGLLFHNLYVSNGKIN